MANPNDTLLVDVDGNKTAAAARMPHSNNKQRSPSHIARICLCANKLTTHLVHVKHFASCDSHSDGTKTSNLQTCADKQYNARQTLCIM